MKRETTSFVMSAFVLSAIFLCFTIKESTGETNLATNEKDEYYSAFDSASWAVTSNDLSPLLGAHKQSLYDDYISACDAAIVKEGKGHAGICTNNDKQRMRMNRDQPSSVYNYTKNGYAKTRAPADLYNILKAFFDKNRHRAQIEWKEYNVYHNAWEAPPTFVDVHPENVGKKSLTSVIEDKVKPILEEWTGQRLSPVRPFDLRPPNIYSLPRLVLTMG